MARWPHPLEHMVFQQESVIQRRADVCSKQDAQYVLSIGMCRFSGTRQCAIQWYPARHVNDPIKRCLTRPCGNGNIPADRHGKCQRVQNEMGRQGRHPLPQGDRRGQGWWAMSQPPEKPGCGQNENRYSGRFVQRRYRCLDLPRVEIIYSPSEYDGREHAHGYQPVKANCDTSVFQSCDILGHGPIPPNEH